MLATDYRSWGNIEAKVGTKSYIARCGARPHCQAEYGCDRWKTTGLSAEQIYVPPQRIGFRTLSHGEAAHALAVVESALAAFELHGYAVADFIKHSNVTARLVSVGAPSLALRLRVGPSVDGRTEFEWLNAVRQGTRVRVIEPFASNFRSNTRVVADGNGRPVECALFLWAEGQPLAANLSEANYYELGRVSAQLHEFASRWVPPTGLRPLLWDRTMYYEGSSLVIADSRNGEFISRRDAETVEAVLREADLELGRLATAPDRMFLHGNIEMWNVLTTRPGELRLLDFEDVMFGPPVFDVAITLYYGRERPDYGALSTAYEAGYRSLRDWPVRDCHQMNLLFAARAAMLLNHALLTEQDKRSVTDRLLPLILAAAR
jgi:Ser/Thr protein kinase RdoA (MazF antagonist)